MLYRGSSISYFTAAIVYSSTSTFTNMPVDTLKLVRMLIINPNTTQSMTDGLKPVIDGLEYQVSFVPYFIWQYSSLLCSLFSTCAGHAL